MTFCSEAHFRFPSDGQETKMAPKTSTSKTTSTKTNSLCDCLNGLEAKAKTRYEERLSLCDGVDPYTLKNNDFSTDFRNAVAQFHGFRKIHYPALEHISKFVTNSVILIN